MHCDYDMVLRNMLITGKKKEEKYATYIFYLYLRSKCHRAHTPDIFQHN